MAERVEKTIQEKTNENHLPAKRRYQDPAFRFEQVFETMALACGKVGPTNLQCRFNRHSS